MKRFFASLEELRLLNLPVNKYAISGSGPLAVRRIRDIQDLDVLVKKDILDYLVKKYSLQLQTTNGTFIQIGNLEIRSLWLEDSSLSQEMIDTAELIYGLPFVKLKYVIRYKKKLGRKKDYKDIQLINEFIKNQTI